MTTLKMFENWMDITGLDPESGIAMDFNLHTNTMYWALLSNKYGELS